MVDDFTLLLEDIAVYGYDVRSRNKRRVPLRNSLLEMNNFLICSLVNYRNSLRVFLEELSSEAIDRHDGELYQDGVKLLERVESRVNNFSADHIEFERILLSIRYRDLVNEILGPLIDKKLSLEKAVEEFRYRLTLSIRRQEPIRGAAEALEELDVLELLMALRS